MVAGDGSEGLPEHAPLDAIVAAAAFPSVPGTPSAQLAEAGRLVQPLGPGGAEEAVLFEKPGPATPSVRTSRCGSSATHRRDASHYDHTEVRDAATTLPQCHVRAPPSDVLVAIP
jgi:protein-L-isoaspartate O-methyltransferase